ncbi:MAG TPA: UDP-N-acetylmuramoyl-tripeptide--D-alanyl-D-alanine ligase [Chloroflexi bacterium]|nr:UDP-N-acetylmuramoyl-tripeptide--D-alanyl-D-alanine ligase [Chloroflexota bacterium]
MITLGVVLEVLTGKSPHWADLIIADVGIDSRTLIPGSMFVALQGETADGHDYVSNAFENGASFALIDRAIDPQIRVIDCRPGSDSDLDQEVEVPFCLQVEDTLAALQQVAGEWRKRLDLRVIGITGSVGKSTTKELTTTVLKQRYRTLKNPGNLNNEIGLPMTLWRLSEGHQRAVLEMGFYVPGEIEFLCNLAQPAVGVLTTIGTVHAERAGSQDEIARGKSELVQALPPGPEGVAILNYDDELVRAMADQTQARIFYYGLSPDADLWADEVEGLGLEGIKFRLNYQGESIYLKVPLIGRHSVHTVLRAAAVGLVEGLSWDEIGRGLRSEHTQLRLIAVRSSNGALILDDTYNASPKSMLADLNLLEDMDGRKVAVLGDMLELGRYEHQGHMKVGIRAAEVADVLVTVGERAEIIARAAAENRLDQKKIHSFAGSTDVISFLNEFLQENDIVLVKGSRGMRMDKIVAALEVGS